METLLLSIHVVAGILFVGPVAVATSLFPRYAPILDETSVESVRDLGVARALRRITGVYGRLAIVVPVAGLVLAAVQGRSGDAWVVAAMILTAAAGALLAFQIAPRQSDALQSPDDGAQLRQLSMLAGVLNLIWVIVVVLMIARPGAAT